MGGGSYMLTLLEASSLLNLPVSHIESVLFEERDDHSDELNDLFDDIGDTYEQ